MEVRIVLVIGIHKHFTSTVKEQDVFTRHSFVHEFAHLLNYKPDVVFFRVSGKDHYLMFRLLRRANGFFHLELIVTDHFIARSNDMLRASVVQIQLDNPGISEVFLEVYDVADVGSAEPIDALPVIADTKKLCVVGQQQLDEVNQEKTFVRIDC